MRFLSLFSLVLLGFVISLFSSAVLAQEVSSTPSVTESEAVSLSADVNASTNKTAPSLPANSEGASPAMPPASSFSTNSEETNDALQATDSSASVVPTDPSMVPSSENQAGSSLPLPTDPNAAAASEVTEEDASSSVLSTESIEKKKHELKVQYTAIRTRVEKEAGVAELRLKADHAATDEGKRQALRAYYELLFKRMKEIDSSLSERCDLMQGAYLRRLDQKRLEPTIPLHMAPVVQAPVDHMDDVSPSKSPQKTVPVIKEKVHKKKHSFVSSAIDNL